MRIDLGGGAYMESDDRSRDKQFRMRILRTERIPGTQHGHVLFLACGHQAGGFGDINKLGGRALCMICRDARN